MQTLSLSPSLVAQFLGSADMGRWQDCALEQLPSAIRYHLATLALREYFFNDFDPADVRTLVALCDVAPVNVATNPDASAGVLTFADGSAYLKTDKGNQVFPYASK